MSNELEKRCPDCDHLMMEVRLLDRTHGGEGDVEYTVPDAKRGFWTNRYPVHGKVNTLMCDQCGRILLFGKRPAST